MRKLRVLVDFDDTLFQLLPHWINTLNRRFGTNVVPKQINSWHIAEYFPSHSVEEVFQPLKENSFWKGVIPMEGSIPCLEDAVQNGHEVYILTASCPESVFAKSLLLREYFPFLDWQHVIVAARKQLVDGDMLIDDAVHNLVGGSYTKLLFTSVVNCQYDATANGMVRVNHWDEVQREIQHMSLCERTKCRSGGAGRCLCQDEFTEGDTR